MKRTTLTTLLGLCIVSLGLAAPSYGASAGKFLVVIGDVRIVDEGGKVRRARRGAKLNRGDTIKTANRSLAQVQMADRGRISVRSDTEMRLSRFEYKGPTDKKGSMSISLLRGALRSITGLIGRFNRKGYKLKTPHATIGIRGTDHETTVLLEPRAGFKAGTFDQVFSGQTIVRTELGTVNVLPKQAAFVGANSRRPQIIKVPKFLKQMHASPKVAARKVEQKQGKTRITRKRSAKRKAVLLNPLQSRTAVTSTNTLTTSPTTILKTISPTTTTLSPTTTTTLKTLSSTSTTTLSPTTSTTTTTLKTLSPTTSTTTTTLKTLSPTTSTTTTTLRRLRPTTSTTTLSPTTTTSRKRLSTTSTSSTTTTKTLTTIRK